MRKGFKNVLVILVLLVMLGNALERLAASTQWAPYTSRQGGYTVTLPGKPMESTRTMEGPSGPVELRYVATEAVDRSGVYGAAYVDMPSSVLDPHHAACSLDVMTHAFPGRLLSKRTITFQGHAGREFSVQREKGVTTVRLFFVGQRLYELMATSPDPAVSPETLATFLGSFRLIPKG